MQLKNTVLLKQLRPDHCTVTHRTVTREIFTHRFNILKPSGYFTYHKV